MTKEKSRILAYLPFHRVRQAPRGPWALAGGLALFVVVAASGSVPGPSPLEVRQQSVIEPLQFNPVVAESAATFGFVQEQKIRPGDTADRLFARLGIDDPATLSALRATPGVDILFQQIAPGKTLTVQVDEEGQLQSLVFPLNGENGRALFIERRDSGFSVHQDALQTERHVVLKSGEINYSLFGATDTAGIPDGIATQLADIFGGDIDFHRDLRKGDRFSVTYESVTHHGNPVKSGKILAAEFVNAGKRYQAVWFGDSSKGGYYAPDGKSLRKAFLRSPLEFSRVTSGFTSARFHPVLQQWRAHRGVDYGAPIGTRVRATGDGVIDFVGTQGGYGKVVMVRHQNRYTTVYGHLSGFAAGLRKGSRVSQGDIIAYTGATGLASGPHLHYEFRVDGQHQNPLTVALPGAPPLAASQMAKFQEIRDQLFSQLNLIAGSNLALLD